MAVLQQPVNNSNAFADLIGESLAATGTFVATVLDIKDEFKVRRQKFQSTEMEEVDLTTFLFGYRDKFGNPHKVASKRMKISGNEKSTLFAFLKSLLGCAPLYGWDYAELKRKQCLLTVEHIQRRDGTGVFAAIAALSPVPAEFVANAGMGQPASHGSFAGPGGTGSMAQPAPQAGYAVPAVAGRSAAPAPAGRTMPTVAPVVPQMTPVAAMADDEIPF